MKPLEIALAAFGLLGWTILLALFTVPTMIFNPTDPPTPAPTLSSMYCYPEQRCGDRLVNIPPKGEFFHWDLCSAYVTYRDPNRGHGRCVEWDKHK